MCYSAKIEIRFGPETIQKKNLQYLIPVPPFGGLTWPRVVVYLNKQSKFSGFSQYQTLFLSDSTVYPLRLLKH